MMRKYIEKQHQKYNKLSDLGSHLEATRLSPFPLQHVFLTTWFSEPLRGTPWTDFGLPGAPLIRFSSLLNIIYDQNWSKCQRLSRAAFRYFGNIMPPNTPSNNQASIEQQQTHNQSKQIRTSCVCLSNPRNSKPPGLF